MAQALWKPRLPHIRASARALLDLVLPPRTLDGSANAQSDGLSAEGWTRIAFIEAPVCDGCGSPFELDFGPAIRCPACTTRPRMFSRARAACLYDESSRELILQLKHADRARSNWRGLDRQAGQRTPGPRS